VSLWPNISFAKKDSFAILKEQKTCSETLKLSGCCLTLSEEQ